MYYNCYLLLLFQLLFCVDNWGDDFPAAEDWDNEEYTVSLADTKVFTASSAVVPESPAPAGDQGLSNGDKFVSKGRLVNIRLTSSRAIQMSISS